MEYYRLRFKGDKELVDSIARRISELDSPFEVLYSRRHGNTQISFESVIGGKRDNIEGLLRGHNGVSSQSVTPVNRVKVTFKSVPYDESVGQQRQSWYRGIWSSFDLQGEVKIIRDGDKSILQGSFSGSPENVSRAVDEMSGTASFNYTTE